MNDETTLVGYMEKRRVLKQLSVHRLKTEYGALRLFLKYVQSRNKTFSTLSEEDVVAIIDNLQRQLSTKGKPFSECTKYDYWATFKAFYKELNKSRIYDRRAYRLCIDYTYKKNASLMTKKACFDEAEARLIVHMETNVLWNTFFSVMFDAGPRIGEALAVRVKDVTEYEDETVSIYLPISKTTPRTVYFVGETARKLSRLIYFHPHKHLPEAPFFINEYLRPVSYKAAENRFKTLVERSGLIKDKPCLHSLRISSATNDASRLTDQENKRKHGWKQASPMLNTYVQNASIDVKNAELRAYRRSLLAQSVDL